VTQALQASERHPLLIDRYCKGAIEVDVECDFRRRDGGRRRNHEHVEHAVGYIRGIARARCATTLSAAPAKRVDRADQECWRANLGVIRADKYSIRDLRRRRLILEVNPRASRTIPFVSKAIGVPLAKYAALVMSGKKLSEIGFTTERVPAHVAVKESVFPFGRFPGVDTILGPEMKSTGEVMGIDTTFAMAFAKASLAASSNLPDAGLVFISVRDDDKKHLEPIARGLVAMGFDLIATQGTAGHIRNLGLQCESVNRCLKAARI